MNFVDEKNYQPMFEKFHLKEGKFGPQIFHCKGVRKIVLEWYNASSVIFANDHIVDLKEQDSATMHGPLDKHRTIIEPQWSSWITIF